MRHSHTSFVNMLVGLVVLGCDGSEAATGGGGLGGGGGSEPHPPSLAFSPCPLRETEPFTPPPAGPVSEVGFEGGLSPIGEWLAYADQSTAMDAAMAECATMEVPADWNDPGGDSIDVFVKRYPATTGPATGRLWLLEGGPGYPSATMEHTAFLLAASNPTLDIYLPDHRGTGRSTFIACDEHPVSECAQAVPHLVDFTTTNAAKDLAALIDATEDGTDLFVYGVSYGTFWAQRYLQLRPDQPTAVVLDSLVPVVFDFAEFDHNFDVKAHEILALCAADPTCSAKLGGDPVARAQEVIDNVSSVCDLPSGPQAYFGALVGGDVFDKLLLPASIYRVLRCDDADREWLAKVAAYHEWYWHLFDAGYSYTLSSNIRSSEMWQSDATFEELWEARKELLAFDASAFWASEASAWPRYPRDELWGRWPESPAPTLVLQGGLDARTPYGEVARAQYDGAHQHYVELPYATHGVLWPLASPMSDLGEVGCGAQIVTSFLSDPTKAPDSTCVANMAPVDFANPPAEWLALIGIGDLWENP